MKRCKKIISIIIAAVMITSFISVPSFAALGAKFTLKDGASAVISAGYIFGLNAEGTKLSDIKDQLTNDSDNVIAVNNKGVAVADDEYIGTGATVKLVNGGNVLDQLTVIIFGDVDGDGAIDGFDLYYVDKAINNITVLKGAYAIAADIDNDGAVDGNDYSATLTDIAGFEPVDQNGSIDLPEASINEITPVAVGQYTPDTAVEFSSTQTLAEIEGKTYADWDVDFVLMFNRAVNKKDIYLFGQYGTYDWMGGKLAQSGTLAAGEEFSIVHTWLADAFGQSSFALTYEEIITFVNDFKCAIFDLNPEVGLEASVQLIMTEPNGTVHVIDTVSYTWTSIALPEAEITEVIPETISGIIPDAEFEFEPTQTLDEIEGRNYADWDVDFVLSFNQDVNKNEVYLAGQYGTYGWISAKIAESGTLAADEEFSVVHTWLADVLEKDSFALTYEDIVRFVRDFKCAIYAPYAQPGLVATLQLIMTDNVTGETYVRSIITHTFEKYIPNAQINPVAADSAGDNNDGILVGFYSSEEVSADAALSYSSTETLADVQGKQCLNYTVDFEITFSKTVEAEKVYLFGQYDNPYGLGWVGDKLSVVPGYDNEGATIPANTKVGLITDIIGPSMGRTLVLTYRDILNEVGVMKTALHVENPEDGLKVTVDLVMTDTFTGDRYVVSSYEYTYTMPELPDAPNISQPSMTNKVTSGGKTYSTDLYIRYTTNDTAASIADKEYKDWNVDLLISFNQTVDGSNVHLFGKKGANSWADGMLSNTIAAGKKTALLNDFLGETLTYSELVASGTNGLRFAIDVTNPPTNLVLTAQFVITDPSNGKRYVIDTLTFSGF